MKQQFQIQSYTVFREGQQINVPTTMINIVREDHWIRGQIATIRLNTQDTGVCNVIYGKVGFRVHQPERCAYDQLTLGQMDFPGRIPGFFRKMKWAMGSLYQKLA